MSRRKELTGQKFGKLLVLSPAYSKNWSWYWNCVCDCGNKTIARGASLSYGSISSCGCGGGHRTHEETNTPLYKIYMNMIKRCNNKKDKHYGGKGITVCEEWKNDFTAFREWSYKNNYEEGLSVERINNDKDYSPTNCKWIPLNEQNQNRVTSKYITFKEQTKTVAQWANIYHFNYNTLFNRFQRWSVEDALLTPKGKRKGERSV